MVTRSRRLVMTASLMLLLGACGSRAQSSPESTAAPSTIAPSESVAASPDAGQTDTEWGRIWDTVPGDFPVFPGAAPADDGGGEPVSARFAVEGGDPEAIATWLQDALEQAMFSTLGLNGPGEDGGFVIDSTGDGECRIQTSVTPLGGQTFVSIRYGADCPAP
jgi:hypothetical protein